MTSQIRQQQPGLFSQLLGGALGGGGGTMGSGGMMGNTGASGGVSQMLNSPIAKAALAGIAATAVQRMMNGQRR
jgi:hypothetical protein